MNSACPGLGGGDLLLALALVRTQKSLSYAASASVKLGKDKLKCKGFFQWQFCSNSGQNHESSVILCVFLLSP